MNIKKAVASIAVCGLIFAVPITQRIVFNYNLHNNNLVALNDLKLHNTPVYGNRTGGCVMRTFSCVVDRSGKCQR